MDWDSFLWGMFAAVCIVAAGGWMWFYWPHHDEMQLPDRWKEVKRSSR